MSIWPLKITLTSSETPGPSRNHFVSMFLCDLPEIKNQDATLSKCHPSRHLEWLGTFSGMWLIRIAARNLTLWVARLANNNQTLAPHNFCCAVTPGKTFTWSSAGSYENCVNEPYEGKKRFWLDFSWGWIGSSVMFGLLGHILGAEKLEQNEGILSLFQSSSAV